MEQSKLGRGTYHIEETPDATKLGYPGDTCFYAPLDRRRHEHCPKTLLLIGCDREMLFIKANAA